MDMSVGGWWLCGCMDGSVGRWVMVVGLCIDVWVGGWWLGGCMDGCRYVGGGWVDVSVGGWWLVDGCVGRWVVVGWMYGCRYVGCSVDVWMSVRGW